MSFENSRRRLDAQAHEVITGGELQVAECLEENLLQDRLYFDNETLIQPNAGNSFSDERRVRSLAGRWSQAKAVGKPLKVYNKPVSFKLANHFSRWRLALRCSVCEIQGSIFV